MNRSIVISGLLGVLSLAACDRTPTVINMPATNVPVPGPAGPQGAAGSQGETGFQGATGYQGEPGSQGATGSQGETGYQGETGSQGATGKPGESTTVIVTPPAPTNSHRLQQLAEVVPDLARHPGPPVQLEGARGPLSAAQSKAILDRLESRSVETGIFDRHLALEEAIVGSPLTTGNDVRLLQDGPATYQAMHAAIQAAQDHINMETYIFDDDEVGQRFAQALIAKQQQGVQVNLIRDSVGTFDTPAAFFQQLTDSGIQVLEFNPINPLRRARNGR
jgi:hypothetical protein